jgi:outer membrane protein assembly factor BamB
MTHHSDTHDFEQFHGRFNSPVSPFPAFAASLKARVTQAPVRGVTETAPATRALHVDTASLPTGAESALEDSWRAPRWMRTIEAAVAVLIVLSLITASVAFRQPAGLWDRAFQPAPETQEQEFNFGGDRGRTWDLGDVEPETGGYRIVPNIPLADMHFGQVGYSRLLVDDSFVFSAGPAIWDKNLVRYDLARSETAWTSPAIVTGEIASDGEHIFAFQSGSDAARDSVTLVAIDFETGDIVWEGPELARDLDSFPALVLSSGTVFATNHLGNVVAVNSDDGSLIWQSPESFATPSPATEVPIGGEGSSFTPEIVANDDAVFVALSTNRTVLKLDRETGADLGTIDLRKDFGTDIIYATIQVRANRLVVAVVHAEQKVGKSDTFGDFPANILVFDAESLHLQTQTDLQNYGGNIVVTDDAAYVPASLEPDGMINVYRLDLATGEIGDPLTGIQTTRGMFLSLSGNVLMVTGYPSSIAFFDLDSGTLIDAFELEGSVLETPFSQQVQMWNPNPTVITALGDIYVFEDESEGTPVATPTVEEQNYGGDAGRTWNLGDAVPEAGGVRQDPAIAMENGQFAGNYRTLHIGNSFVFGMSGDIRSTLVRYDLETHREVWSIEPWVTGSMASDGERIYAVSYFPPRSLEDGDGAARLVAIDFQTGEVVWQGPEVANRLYSANAVALDDGVVYATDYLGNVVAVNAVDGSLVWQYPEVLAEPAADEDRISLSFYSPPELAVNGSAVFVGQPSKSVLKLDRANGEVVDSINLVDQYGADIIHPGVQATDDMLVVTAVRAGRDMSSESDDQYYPATLMVFDPETLELRTTTQIADVRGNALVTDDAIYVAAPATPQTSARLYRIDLETGDLGSPVGTITSEHDMFLSASGGVLMAAAYPSTVAYFDVATGEPLGQVEIDASHMESPFGGPVQMWGSNPVVITALGDVYVFEEKP